MDIKKIALALAAATMAAAGAQADVYVGAGVGVTSVDESGFDDSNGFKLTAGYKVSQHFAIQASYLQLGEFDVNQNMLNAMEDEFSGGFGIDVSLDSVSVESSGFDLSLVGYLPFTENFSGFARLGIYVWDFDSNATVTVDGFTASESVGDSGNDLSYGLGVEYAFNPSWTLVGEWSNYKVADGDISMIGAGINVRF